MLKIQAPSTFDEVNLFFDSASNRLGLSNGLREMLKRPWRELQVQVPVRMGNSEIQVFSGFSVQHNGARGPYKVESATTLSPTSKRCVAWRP